MNDNKNNQGNTVETAPGRNNPADTREEAMEGGLEDRMDQETMEDGMDTGAQTGRDSKDPKNQGQNGNPAQSSGRVTAQEQDAHPGKPIESEGKPGNDAEPDDELDSDPAPRGQQR